MTDQKKLSVAVGHISSVPTIVEQPTEESAVDIAPPAKTNVYRGASEQRFSDIEERVLSEPIPDEYYDILPTGEVYVSHVHYRTILTRAFGRGRWAMVPISTVVVQDTTLCREYALMVSGRFISQAVGEAEYHASNSRMTYATAVETLKSNALTRCCKDLNIASECWDRKWSSRFRKDKCVLVQRRYRSETVYHWRLKSSEPFVGEVVAPVTAEKKQPATPTVTPPSVAMPPKVVQSPAPIKNAITFPAVGSTQSSRTIFFATMGSLGVKNDEEKKKLFNDLLPEYSSTKDVPDELMQKVSVILKGCINEVNALKVDDGGKFYIIDAGENVLLPTPPKEQSEGRGVGKNDPF